MRNGLLLAGACLLLASANPEPAIEARKAASLGKYEQAAALYDEALRRRPQSPRLWTDIARFRLGTGDAGGAIEAVDRALAFGAETGARAQHPAVLLKAQLVRGQYGPRAALAWFERARTLRPDDIDTLTETAATLAETGQAQAALALTRDVLRLDRANPRAFFIQAVIAARAARFDLARALLHRTGGRIDAEPAALLLRGTLEIASGSYEQAIARLEDLLRARPLHFPARRLLALARWRSGDFDGTARTLAPLARRADADPWTLHLNGRALEALGDHAAAAVLLDRAAAARPGAAQSFGLASWPGADPANADVLIPQISRLVEQSRAREAATLAAAMHARNPGSPGAAVALGDALLATGAASAAGNAYRQAANIDFSEPVALRLVAALNQGGQRQEAARVASLFLEQNPRSISALVIAANAALATRRWRRASVLFGTLEQRLGPRDLTARAGSMLARQRLVAGSSG